MRPGHQQKLYQIWPIVSFAAIGLFVGAYSCQWFPERLFIGPISLCVLVLGSTLWYQAERLNAKDQLKFNDLLLGFGVLINFAGLALLFSIVQSDIPEKEQLEHIERSTAAVLVIESDTLTRPYGMVAKAKLICYKTQTGWYATHHNTPLVRLTVRDKLQGQAFSAGDTILTKAQIKQVIARLQPVGFDFGAYLHRQGIYLKSNLDANDYVVRRNQTVSITSLKYQLRNWLESNIRSSATNHDALGLLLGFALGQRQGLDQDVNTEFGITGTAHVLSVSGMHTLVLISVLMAVPTFFGWGRRRKLIWAILSLLILWLYTSISGFSMPAVRSSIMSTFMLLGQLSSRQSRMLHSLSLAVCLIILFEPNSVFDISFHLSIAGCLGISLLAPRWYQQIASRVTNRGIKGFAHASLTTLGAAVATMPISAAQFGYVPTYFMLGNAIIGPLSSLLTILSLLLGILGKVPFVGWVISISAEFLAALTRASVNLLSTLPASTVSVAYWPTLAFIAAAIGIFFLVQRIWFGQDWAYYGLLALPLILATSLIAAKINNNEPQTFAFSRRGEVAMVSSVGDTVYFIGFDPTEQERFAWQRNYPFMKFKVLDDKQSYWLHAKQLLALDTWPYKAMPVASAIKFNKFYNKQIRNEQVVLYRKSKEQLDDDVHCLTKDGYWQMGAD